MYVRNKAQQDNINGIMSVVAMPICHTKGVNSNNKCINDYNSEYNPYFSYEE